jgi:membrane-anchored mycosin MYCP
VYMDGTSMATPYVAAAAALLVQEFPVAQFPTWTPAHVQSCLETSANHLGATPNSATGFGLIDPVAAVSCP